MDEEPKQKEESWAVEPPKKDESKKRKALRVALIVAVLAAAVATGMVLFGGAIRDHFTVIDEAIRGGRPEHMGGEIIYEPEPGNELKQK